MRNRSSRVAWAGSGLPAPDFAADRPRDDAQAARFDPTALETVQVVTRHCRICEWEAQLVERGVGADPLCPWCYGPTERTKILGVVIPEAAAGEKDAAAAALGRRGGLKGGPARAQKLSAKRRREIASKAARARWGKKKG